MNKLLIISLVALLAGFASGFTCSNTNMDFDAGKMACCCNDGYVMGVDDGCCPSNQYYKKDDDSCNLCSINCATCIGAAADQCSSCVSGYHLEENNGAGARNCV